MSKVYVDFDSLFDCRIAVIESISRATSRRLARNKEYFNRLTDDFHLIDNSLLEVDYKNAYDKRSELSLDMLTTTGIAFELRREQQERVMARAGGIDVEEDTLVINTWPFSLDEDDRLELSDVLIEVTRIPRIQMISMVPDTITPTFLQNFRQVIMYDLNLWLELHYESLAINPLPKVRFITPLLFKGKEKPKLSLGQLVDEVKEKLRPYMLYSPMPVGEFSFFVE